MWVVQPEARAYTLTGDELRSFRFCLHLMCMDQSSVFQSLVSWSLFLLLGITVPVVSHFILDYSPYHHPYDSAVQLSLTLASALAFLRLSALLSRYGLCRLLFMDKLPGESDRVRIGYTTELSRSFRLLACFVVPCTTAKAAYKVWWYCAGSVRILFLGNATTSDIVAFTLELASWVYRTGSFFLVCVLFRVICKLQILRLQDFAAVFREESEVAVVLREHLRVRRQLAGDESDEEDIGAEDELEDEKMLQPQANTISFQKRQTLVTYLENKGGNFCVRYCVGPDVSAHHFHTGAVSCVAAAGEDDWGLLNPVLD